MRYRIIGYTRMVLAVIAFYFMQTHYILAGWCYIISALLDAIDGHAARAFNQSEFNANGKMKDERDWIRRLRFCI